MSSKIFSHIKKVIIALVIIVMCTSHGAYAISYRDDLNGETSFIQSLVNKLFNIEQKEADEFAQEESEQDNSGTGFVKGLINKLFNLEPEQERKENSRTGFLSGLKNRLFNIGKNKQETTEKQETAVVTAEKETTTLNASNTTVTSINLVGKNRYETSILVSKNTYPNGSANVILVNGASSIDGSLAGILADKLSAPILLTTEDKIQKEVKKEIERLCPQKVYLIGGISVISESVESELETMSISIERIYGNTRYATAIAIAEKVSKFDKVIICNSRDDSNNVAAIAAIAAEKGIPILYNDSKDSINTDTFNFINKYGENIKTIYMIGNGASTSQINALNEYGISIVEIKGDTPYEINVKMLNQFSTKYDNVVLVNNSIDAVSVSYLAAKYNSLLLYTGTNLTVEQKNIVKSNEISKIYYAGGGKIKGAVKNIISILENEKFVIEDREPQLELDRSKVVFYIPHQDDESLYFSQTILKAIKEKGPENIYVVMISDGTNSAVNISKKHPNYAEVKGLLNKYGLTFSEARDNEFYAACIALGFKEENIYSKEEINGIRLKDGSVKADDVKQTMIYFEEKFQGDVTHIAYSFEFETHKDHQQIGEALNELYYDLTLPEKSFSSVYFVIRQNYQFKDGDTDNIKMIKLEEINYSDRIIDALNKYKELHESTDKSKIRIGIGYKSAGREIDEAIEKIRNKTLVTNIHMAY